MIYPLLIAGLAVNHKRTDVLQGVSNLPFLEG